MTVTGGGHQMKRLAPGDPMTLTEGGHQMKSFRLGDPMTVTKDRQQTKNFRLDDPMTVIEDGHQMKNFRLDDPMTVIEDGHQMKFTHFHGDLMTENLHAALLQPIACLARAMPRRPRRLAVSLYPLNPPSQRKRLKFHSARQVPRRQRRTIGRGTVELIPMASLTVNQNLQDMPARLVV